VNATFQMMLDCLKLKTELVSVGKRDTFKWATK